MFNISLICRDKNVFFTVAAPTLVSAGGAAFIAITSKGYTDNFTEKLIASKKKDGTPLINHVEFDLVCNKCKRKRAYEQEDSCKHLKGDLPWWHSSKRHDELEIMMADFRDEFMRETKGIETDSDRTPVFQEHKIELLKTNMAIYSKYLEPKHIFVSVDPSCGGDNSKTAITSFMYDMDANMIVSI